MKININPDDFRIKPGIKVDLSQIPTSIDSLYENKKDYKEQLEDYRKDIKMLQEILYAHDQWSALMIFQGMDTAGKDGAIKHVMSGINPAGFMVSSFKQPSSEELDHDYMWRCVKKLPQRGRIGIFNRSYYEEVLVVRVHPGILDKQRIPAQFIEDKDKVWAERLEDISHFEKFLHRNGYLVMKFFLHISKEEQRTRLLERIDRPEKNWKMSVGDVRERQFWERYQFCYQEAIGATSTDDCPWFVIPADDKKNARLIISQIVLSQLHKLDMHFPKVSDEHRQDLMDVRKILAEDT